MLCHVAVRHPWTLVSVFVSIRCPLLEPSRACVQRDNVTSRPGWVGRTKLCGVERKPFIALFGISVWWDFCVGVWHSLVFFVDESKTPVPGIWYPGTSRQEDRCVSYDMVPGAMYPTPGNTTEYWLLSTVSTDCVPRTRASEELRRCLGLKAEGWNQGTNAPVGMWNQDEYNDWSVKACRVWLWAPTQEISWWCKVVWPLHVL